MKLKNISESSLYNDLKDPEFAAAYLEDVLQEGSLNAFLIALRSVADANGGVGQLAKATELGRESMYKTLSEEGNPQFVTIHSILKALGLKISITPSEQDAA
jgi:probable addiction module antidote protein